MSPTSELIREIRRSGMSQSDISRRTGISQSRISRWEHDAAPAGADDAFRLMRLAKELRIEAPTDGGVGVMHEPGLCCPTVDAAIPPVGGDPLIVGEPP